MAELAAWNYGEASGPVLDHTGNGRGFSLTGTSTRTAAGNGYTYGGTRPNTKGLTQASAEVQVGPALTGLEPSAWTVATWAKAGAADPSWFLEWYRATDSTGVRGWLTLSGSLRGRIKNSSNTAFEQAVTADGSNWHYFAITHDGTNLKVYRDTGGTVALIGTVAAAFVPWSATELRIFDNSNSGLVLSETRILDTAATLAELQTLSETPVEAAAVSITPAGIAQVQAVGTVALSQHHQLAVSDVAQTQAVEALSVAQTHQIFPVGVGQAQVLGAPVLAAHSVLVVAGVSQVQAVSSVMVSVPGAEFDSATGWTVSTRGRAATAATRQAGYTATTRSEQ